MPKASGGRSSGTFANKISTIAMKSLVKWGCVAPLVGMAALIGLVLALDAFLPSSPRRALPSSATEIHEFYKDYGFTGDFTRLLTAKCSIDEFHAYARQQELDPVIGDELPSGCRPWSRSDESWWTPPSSLAGAYFTFERGYRRILAYHEGRLYYDMTAW